MPSNCQRIRCGSQDHEGTDEIRERSLAAEGDCAESRGKNASEYGSLDGTAEIFIYSGEEPREWDGVVTGQSPPCAPDGEEGPDQARGQRQKDDKQEPERSTGAAGGLSVNLCQWE